ncbi:MAG: lipoate--protein ligase [Clostridia bacterium]|nr:lipoate--protein ligase [Clostridia bacterium]
MITSAKIYLTDCTDPHRNLAMEEAMLHSLPEGQAALFLWQNRHTVVIGSGQNAWRECNTALLEQEGGTLARRSSGGGAVYHDLGNLNFSFIMPRCDYDVDRHLKAVMNALAMHGLHAEKSGRNDLVIGGCKFSGNAFRLMKTSALHHGTLLIDSDMAMVSRYLTPDQDKLKAKGVRSVASRVVNLSALASVSVESMTEAMMDAFRQEYGPAGISVPEETAFPLYPGLLEKHCSWEWNYGASPEGSLELSRRFPWGGVQIYAKITGGAAQEVRVYTDSMDETLARRLTGALSGCPWRGEELARRASKIGEEDVAAWLRETL